MATSAPPKEWLSLREASARIGVSATTLRTWADRGRIRAFRTPGGHRRFHERDLANLAAERSAAPILVPLRVLAHAALGRTRFELSEGSLAREAWYRRFPPGAREEHRELGRRVVTALAETLPQGEEEETLRPRAAELGRAYGLVNRKYNIGLMDALRAFLFFRDTFMDSLLEFARAAPTLEALELLRRVSRFVDAMLLAMVESYASPAGKSIK